MSSTSISCDLNSSLSERILINSKYKTLDKNENIILYLFNKNNCETKNVYNQLNLIKYRGRGKYTNFPIFQKREIEKNNKIKISPKHKMKSISFNGNQSFTTKNSIYITQEIVNGDYSKLPLLLDKMKTGKGKSKNIIFNENKKMQYDKMNILNSDKKLVNRSIQEDERRKIKLLFFNKIQSNFEQKELKTNKSTNISKSDSFLFDKKIYNLNVKKNNDNSISNYQNKLKEYVLNKQIFDLKKEQYEIIDENNINELNKANQLIKEFNSYKELFKDEFTQKYNDYLRHLNLEKERQINKDSVLYAFIYTLKTEIGKLEYKIRKIKNEKSRYIKWMIFQYQLKEKLVKLPKNYEILVEGNYNDEVMKDSIKEIINYIKTNNLYDNPEEIFSYIGRYEQINLELLKRSNILSDEVDLLKKELKEKIIENKKKYPIEAVFIKEKEKNNLAERNALLNKRLDAIKISIKCNYFTEDSELYHKVLQLKSILVEDNSYQSLKKKALLYVLKEIELHLDICLKKQKNYLEKHGNLVEEEMKRLEDIKKHEKIMYRKKHMFDNYIKIREKIIQKSQKFFVKPTRKIYIKNNIKSIGRSLFMKKTNDKTQYNIANFFNFTKNNDTFIEENFNEDK